MKINVAQIGTGRWGKVLYEKLHDHPYIDKVFVGSSNFDFNLDGYQAVVLAVPVEAMFDLAKKSLLSGKHVFVEKPGAKSVDELKELISIAQERDLILQVGYQHNFDLRNSYPTVRSIIKRDFAVNHVWLKDSSSSTSAIENLLCHEISRLMYILKAQNVLLIEKQLDVRELKTGRLTLLIDGKTVTFSFAVSQASSFVTLKHTTYQTPSTVAEFPPVKYDLVGLEIDHFVGAITDGLEPMSLLPSLHTRMIIDEIECR